ncbi:diguanylate cyclase (GGDEF)-like protein [Plasticicumulans lactativorans]|uniref:Diguanylate cyclase (GGDEF)-like protein n=1 Tax=Plasticicumulans lactativorans TaxID=1133106 RepID=A0A4R2L2T5_9GAMM|nr:diguanylate cyclase [Plasticicumulans lactativorans]TCO81431.1 diguanylate cyclase (GGDEF)-like protein [Plasticicumulans lactativorans]
MSEDRPAVSPAAARALLIAAVPADAEPALAALRAQGYVPVVVPALAFTAFPTPLRPEALAGWLGAPPTGGDVLGLALLTAGTAIAEAPEGVRPADAAMRERLEQELARCARYRHTLALALLEPDGAAALAHRFGERAGRGEVDELGGWLQRRLRRTDVVGAGGGLRCALILPETDAAAALTVIERLRIEYLQRRQRERALGYVAGFSAGLAAGAGDAAPLWQAALGALERAQAAGGDCVRLAEVADPP